LELLEKLAAIVPLPRVHLGAMPGVWHCTVRGARQSFRRRASRVRMGRRPTLERLAGAGPGCWGACLLWI